MSPARFRRNLRLNNVRRLLDPNRKLITGIVCGVRVENIDNSIIQEYRYLDKPIDEAAKGKAMEKIKFVRSPSQCR